MPVTSSVSELPHICQSFIEFPADNMASGFLAPFSLFPVSQEWLNSVHQALTSPSPLCAPEITDVKEMRPSMDCCPTAFPGGTSGKEPACQCSRPKRHGFNPWVRKIPWKRAWHPTPVFLPGESPWTGEPGRLQPMGVSKSQTWLSNVAHSTHAVWLHARPQTASNSI